MKSSWAVYCVWIERTLTDYGLCVTQFEIFIKNKKWRFWEFLWFCKLRQIESILSASIGSRLWFQRLHRDSRFQLATPVDFFCVYYRRLQFEFEKWEVSKIWTFDNYASVLWLCYILIFGKQFIVGQNRVRSFHFGGQWKWLNLTLFREINLIFIHYFEPRSYAQYGKTKNLVLDYVVPSKDFSLNQLHFT